MLEGEISVDSVSIIARVRVQNNDFLLEGNKDLRGVFADDHGERILEKMFRVDALEFL